MARYFSVRRPNPLRGPLQVVEVAEGRAFSADGAGWQVELRSARRLRQPPWGDIGPGRNEPLFFVYGRWSSRQGLTRVPVNPLLGDQSGHPALEPLLTALEGMPALPFAPGDDLELWLLDGRAGRPLALLQSLAADAAPPLARVPPWEATPVEDPGFQSPAYCAWAQSRGRSASALAHRQVLADLVRAVAGSPPAAQWFRRDGQGGGSGLEGCGLPPGLAGRRLEAAEFPEMLLRSDWEEEPLRGLVADLLQWQAPALLALWTLSREQRSALEHAAARRALALHPLQRLLPLMVNREVLAPALVEAVLRRSA
jgi:hypothetical protein